MGSSVINTLAEIRADAVGRTAGSLLGSLVQQEQYVGEVFSIGYESALVQIHDFYRQRVGGIPSLSFLIATRLDPDKEIDYTLEDASVILLRVMDAAPLPNEAEALRVRVETAQRVSGESFHWDEAGAMDAATHNLLSFAGVKCRVIGTFYLDKAPSAESDDDLALYFGSDLSNYYPNRGLKVYKANGAALGRIVNYREPNRSDADVGRSVPVGVIRYASTSRPFQGVADVKVQLMPGDLLQQKTALFGMTRTGKSNTTKVIIKSMFELRHEPSAPLRVGQLVFDPNGEYANVNVQDQTAIKKVWAASIDGAPKDVVTYGILPHPDDPGRRLMLLNFFKDENLSIGKETIDAALAGDNAKYIQGFRQVSFDPPDPTDRSATVRFNRRVLVYRTLLARAGFEIPAGLVPITAKLFNKELLDAMAQSDEPLYQSAAKTISAPSPTWHQLSDAFVQLNEFMKGDAYKAFEQSYINRPNGSGDPWADEDLKKILEMFRYPNGARMIGGVRNQHSAKITSDFAEDIYQELCKGKLVIIDQSSGDPDVNQSSADRIMWRVFRGNQELFRGGKTPPDILLYVEEAHNLLPQGSEEDLKNVWVRTAKEGAKYNVGMVYATQEVSSIQRNILKNTANWFIGHLNNTDETRELCKYYDFADFEPSIRRAQDRGFLRVKTLSNKFVIPVQIVPFRIDPIED